MDKVWEHHFKYYDLFQNNSDRYRKIVGFHLMNLEKFKKILDTGAGTGNLTLELLREGHGVTVVDTDESSLGILKRKCSGYMKKLKVKNMNVQELNFGDGEFDGVSSMFVIPFVKDNRKYFSEVYRVLKDSGKFSISAWAPVPDSLTGLRRLLKKEFEQKGLLPKYQKEWDYIFESSSIHFKTVVKGPNDKELEIMLRETGFKNIKVYSKNPYGKYAYFMTCEK